MMFENILTDDIVQFICNETIRYANVDKNDPSFSISVTEMRIFIAILIFSGYHTVPEERNYWSLDEDLGIPLVYDAMSRDRFLIIKKYLHLANNSDAKSSTDRMFKLRPLINMLRERFQQYGYIHTNLSIDESMVKYFGKHPAKQFIRGKPIRFGYKVWMLTSSSGYCYDFEVYCGKNSSTPRSLPLGPQVVINFLEKIPHPENHQVFFDNYFTTHALMKLLHKMNFRASGTVRENRITRCPLDKNKIFAKKRRGTYDYSYDTTNDILAVKWVDNNVCSMLTNFDNIAPPSFVKRWSAEERCKVNVPQPKLYATYNQHMGGVDNLDQNLNAYRIALKGKKWWWVIFTYLIDLAVTNAWKLYLLSPNCTTDFKNQLNFRRWIVRTTLVEARSSKSNKKRKPSSSLEGVTSKHVPKKNESQLRCVVCHQRSMWSCSLCNKTLCIKRDCFSVYHK